MSPPAQSVADCERWRAFTAKALNVAAVASGTGVTVALSRIVRCASLTDNGGVSEGQRTCCHSGGATEFEKSEGLTLGDVVISVEQAARQAREHGLEFDEEVSQLILHGVLHLCGYDHETDNGEMNALELPFAVVLEYNQ